MAADGHTVALARRLLGVAESGYYEWRERPLSARALRHAQLTETIRTVHAASRGTYGSRRVTAELVLGLGISVGHGQVELLCETQAYRGSQDGNAGVTPSPTPTRQTWSNATSPGRGPTRSGPPTSLNTRPAKARSTARPSWTLTPGAWSAGPSTPPRPRRWSPTPCPWQSATAARSPARSSTPTKESKVDSTGRRNTLMTEVFRDGDR